MTARCGCRYAKQPCIRYNCSQAALKSKTQSHPVAVGGHGVPSPPPMLSRLSANIGGSKVSTSDVEYGLCGILLPQLVLLSWRKQVGKDICRLGRGHAVVELQLVYSLYVLKVLTRSCIYVDIIELPAASNMSQALGFSASHIPSVYAYSSSHI